MSTETKPLLADSPADDRRVYCSCGAPVADLYISDWQPQFVTCDHCGAYLEFSPVKRENGDIRYWLKNVTPRIVTKGQAVINLPPGLSASDARHRLETWPALLAACKAIAAIAGNLSDENIESSTGPNDARGRGIMVTSARTIAREAIAAAEGTK